MKMGWILSFTDDFCKVVLDEEEWYCREREEVDDYWNIECLKYEEREPPN